MHGDPAGLQRIDDLFHINFYNPTFTGNPLPWGAWPSLHSGFASYSAIFLTYLYPKVGPIFFIYVVWIWWATMYLGHHYLVDLIGGFIYALLCALCAIIYLEKKKPYHKDYAELKSIMIQEYELGLLSGEYNASHRAQKFTINTGKEEVTDSERKLIGGSHGTVADGESTTSNDQLTAVNEGKYTNNMIPVTDNNNNNNMLGIPNDSNMDRLSVMSNMDKESTVVDQ